MNRRSVLKSLGATTIAGSAVLGSGALTQVTASRNVDISVTSDDSSVVQLTSGTAAQGGFASVGDNLDNNDNGQLGFKTGDINAGGELLVGSASGSDPTTDTVNPAAFKIADNASLGANTAMGLDITVKPGDNTNSGLGLFFLPETANDMQLAVTSESGTDYSTRDLVAGKNLSSGGSTFPSLPSQYDTGNKNNSATFILDEATTVGAQLLVQAAPGDRDQTEPSFTIDITAETVDTQ